MLRKTRRIIIKTIELKAGYVFALSRSTEGRPLMLSFTEA